MAVDAEILVVVVVVVVDYDDECLRSVLCPCKTIDTMELCMADRFEANRMCIRTKKLKKKRINYLFFTNYHFLL